MNRKKALAVLLIIVLLVPVVGMAAETAKAEAIKAKMGKIPLDTAVEIKLIQMGGRKINGTLLSVKDEAFEFQSYQTGDISLIPFADVQSVKAKRGENKVLKALKVAGGVALVAGYFALAVTSQMHQ